MAAANAAHAEEFYDRLTPSTLKIPRRPSDEWRVLSRAGTGNGCPPSVESEAAAIAKEKLRLALRALRGASWDGQPSNDNQPWPLLKAITHAAENASDSALLARAARHYREIEWLSGDEAPLSGSAVDTDDVISLDQRVRFGGNGELEYVGVRELKGKAAPTDSRNAEDRLIDRIDARAVLKTMRDSLGPLLRPFEDAVIHGRSLTAIGRDEGFSNDASAAAAGKALVYRGLRVVAGIAAL